MNHTAGNIRSDDLNRNMIESSKKPPQLMRVLTSHNVCYARFLYTDLCPGIYDGKLRFYPKFKLSIINITV